MKESEDKYRIIFDSSRDAILLLDPEKGYIDCNPAALKMFAVKSKKEFCKLNPMSFSFKFQLDGSLSSELATKEINKAIKNGQNLFEWLYKDLNGREFFASILATPLKLSGKTIIQCTIRDITKNKKAEEALQESEAFLNETGSIAKIGAWKINLETQKLMWTKELFKLHELPDDFQPTIEKAIDFYDNDSKEIIKKAVQDAIEHGKAFDLELGIITAKNKHINVHTLGNIQKNKNGKIVYIVGTFQDITERKLIEKKVESISKFPSENSNPVFRISGNGDLLYSNEATKEILKGWGYYNSNKIPEYWKLKVKKIIESGKLTVIDETINMQTFSFRVVPVKRENYVNLYGENITESKKAEKKHKKLQAQLIQSQKMDAIGQLAGGVAHDFNNMLAGIISAAELLKSSKQKLDAKEEELIEVILNASNRATELTAKLLAFGRKGKVTSRSVDVHTIIDETIALLNRTINKKIKILVSKNASNSIVTGDDSALQNSLLNLGINASHAMKTGGELLIETENIHLSEAYCNSSLFDIKTGNYIRIKVQDTGCGFSPENIKKIFEPFFTTKKQGKGTGLGLASVYGTIQNHHGEINVHSEVNIGTIFYIYLPCSDKVLKEVPKAIEKTILKASGLILLVDDEEVIRRTSKYILEKMGFKVILAKNGLEAVNIFKNKFAEIDLVITDMIMPEMNGSEAFYKMKEIDANCKVIISSGFTKNESLEDLIKEGLAGFIQKPFTNNQLHQLLRKVLGSL